MSAVGIPQIFSYPAMCLCGHSEYVYGWTQGEIEFQKQTRTRYFCTSCSISPETKRLEDRAREMLWLDCGGKRDWVVARVRALTRRAKSWM